MRTVAIEVTQDDIKAGGSTVDTCPIARAVQRVVRSEVGVGVTPFEVRVAVMRPLALATMELPLPDVARCFVLDYDEGEQVGPFAFEMALPEDALREETT